MGQPCFFTKRDPLLGFDEWQPSRDFFATGDWPPAMPDCTYRVTIPAPGNVEWIPIAHARGERWGYLSFYRLPCLDRGLQ